MAFFYKHLLCLFWRVFCEDLLNLPGSKDEWNKLRLRTSLKKRCWRHVWLHDLSAELVNTKEGIRMTMSNSQALFLQSCRVRVHHEQVNRALLIGFQGGVTFEASKHLRSKQGQGAAKLVGFAKTLRSSNSLDCVCVCRHRSQIEIYPVQNWSLEMPPGAFL